MQVTDTKLDGVKIITPRKFNDDRGWFFESWTASKMKNAGIACDFVQDNHSFSRPKGTLRGLHYQAPPHAQDKLVRCSKGAILDVAVDVRKGSPTFKDWVAIELSVENNAQLFIPKGFLHGFVTLEENCEVQYKCSDFYAPDCDGSVYWDSLGVDWGDIEDPSLSAKDMNAPRFEDWETPFHYGDMA